MRIVFTTGDGSRESFESRELVITGYDVAVEHVTVNGTCLENRIPCPKGADGLPFVLGELAWDIRGFGRAVVGIGEPGLIVLGGMGVPQRADLLWHDPPNMMAGRSATKPSADALRRADELRRITMEWMEQEKRDGS